MLYQMFFVFVVDESGPAAMQHGNSANNIQPLQIFQKTGTTMLKKLQRFILSRLLYIVNKSTSVNEHPSDVNEEDGIWNNTQRSIVILLILVTHLLSIHFIVQRHLLSSFSSYSQFSRNHETFSIPSEGSLGLLTEQYKTTGKDQNIAKHNDTTNKPQSSNSLPQNYRVFKRGQCNADKLQDNNVPAEKHTNIRRR